MSLEIGKKYYVETTTKYWVGILVSVEGPHALTLGRASWVAETGRFSEFLRTGKAQGMEVEPVLTPNREWAILNVTGYAEWPHDLWDKSVGG
jgi:hypothetical protein